MIGSVYETMYYSSVQRIFQIASFKARQEQLTGEKVNSQRIMQLWNSKVKTSSGEAVTEGFVDAGMAVFKAILCQDGVRSHVTCVWAFAWLDK